ncbi:TylF/MycF family methyltransferase [Bacillus pseudomycoides]|uniref:Macrocin O-methyltransferase n=1 Tax=Bacillus pseudomycoides TaxID=64104 RepID=A0ABD6T513_9BACI|nr:TylF/MycF family methyltransferase [Bacillus pseudomycoides]EEM08372.1 Bacteriocin O-metyltransferase [Bacillus pseudomycoides]PDZ71501.1 macrocin O-methyltransferase [Bacillus pseudomycoides]PEP80364.1 macrocin O-methyltransferase [Bacillus pseudomycoides]PGF06612.1 macrocin O-methyltransferase [Bacillus pseudomycoides]PHE93445.1 macrocin O-methyltransferase [Bacillus pseudomycoides]
MSIKQETNLYLELLKKAILFEIWQEHEIYLPTNVPIPSDLNKFIQTNNLKLVHSTQPNPKNRQFGLDWPVIAHSMIGRVRLNQLHSAMETVIQENIAGDFIETGVWRGGSCIFMRGFLKSYDIQNRNIWVADSFEGLPAPNIEKYPQDAGDTLYTIDFLRVSLEEVQQNFKKYDLLDNQVKFLKGWFKDTLPSAPIQKIAIARLDGDLYESTMDSLINLYNKISPGGFIIIDDYFLPGCRAAVTDFCQQNNITEPLIQIDQHSVYWRKSIPKTNDF